MMAKLSDLLADLATVETVPREAIPQLRGELAQLDTLLLSRLLTAKESEPVDDQLLDVPEAARRLGISESYLQHNHKRLPFTRRVGRKLLFSAKGLEKHISKLRT